MKILSASQIRQADAYTIKHEPIGSIDLMERASQTFVTWFAKQFPDTARKLYILCGPGNNGGDGLAIARLLHQQLYQVEVILCKIGTTVSTDFSANLERLRASDTIPVQSLFPGAPLPEFEEDALLVDAIFGSGLNRPITGYWAELILNINQQDNIVIAVDISSGMFADRPTTSACIAANHTFTFELPKLAFLFPENNNRTGTWYCRSIGLHPDFLVSASTPFHYLDRTLARSLLRPRTKYAHKGTFGHALLMAGSKGKIGAAILAAQGCLRSGAGLLSLYAPECGYGILQTAVPEAMTMTDPDETKLTSMPDPAPYAAIGIGCGIGQHSATARVLQSLLEQSHIPLVLDADALNLLAANREALGRIPSGSILTPHPKEFERLFGKTRNNFERNALQRNKSRELNAYILLKGAHSCVSTPAGEAYFNSTGNPGMATGGSGDVLTGIITGLLAQGYHALEAALLGMYLHGLAGDQAAAAYGEASMIAGDIGRQLGKAFKVLQE